MWSTKPRAQPIEHVPSRIKADRKVAHTNMPTRGKRVSARERLPNQSPLHAIKKVSLIFLSLPCPCLFPKVCLQSMARFPDGEVHIEWACSLNLRLMQAPWMPNVNLPSQEKDLVKNKRPLFLVFVFSSFLSSLRITANRPNLSP